MTASRFVQRQIAVQGVVGFGSAGLVVVYLVALLRFTPEQWETFAWIIAGYGLFGTVVSEFVMRGSRRPVVAWLRERERDGQATAQAAAAFSAVLDLPRRAFLLALGNYVLAGLVISSGMKIGYPELSLVPLAVVVVATSTAGFAMNAPYFFVLKRMLEPLRGDLVKDLPGPDQRESLAPSLALGTKLLVTLSGVTVSVVLFSVFLAEAHARRPLVGQTAELQRRFLDGAVQRLAEPQAVDALRKQALALGIAQDLEVLDLAEEAPDLLSAAEWQAIRRDSGGQGDGAEYGSSHIFAWLRLTPGKVAVLSLPSEVIQARLGPLWTPFGWLLAAAMGLSILLARMIARDVGRGTQIFDARVTRIATGDLRFCDPYESEDELGSLGRAFERMGIALRRSVGWLSDAAQALDGTVGELEQVGGRVTEATADQVAGVMSARSSLHSLEGQVRGIAQSVRNLFASVEESGSSTLELSAAGEQLNETAEGLSSRVEDVARSIREAVGLAKQIGHETQALCASATETSTSMEEMATSMYEVDANATETARLSQRVVEVSEGGSAQVRQVIEGMDAIHTATEAAEGVIRSLSGRAKEIGAVIDLIDGVADETNLLALNAAIIAAQAGENGRAFSVVAEEIKDLADRVMARTREIGRLIRSVQEESHSAQAAIERGSRAATDGVELSEQAGAALEAITSAARESGVRTQEIVNAVQEQAKAATHVAELMVQVQDRAEKIHAAGEEQAQGHAVVQAGTAGMRELAQQVQRTTEEQARGASQIRDHMAQVGGEVESIRQALDEQSAACSQAVAGMARVAERTQSHEDSVARMGDATRALRQRAESLRNDVRRFRHQ